MTRVPWRRYGYEGDMSRTRAHITRGSNLIRDGQLTSQPVLEISDTNLRNHNRLGCKTELTPHDIRH